MRNEKGQFIKGHRPSISTEFKPGQHWRPHQPFREREYLLCEYVEKQRSTKEIAGEWGVQDSAVIFWMEKHGIPRRTVSETRKIKHWGLSGPANGMFGVRGERNRNWKGGITPERQSLYSSFEWKQASQAVWQRDEGRCRNCGKEVAQGGRFEIHHIVKFAVKHLRLEPLNLVLLCCKCHRWVHSKRNTANVFIVRR